MIVLDTNVVSETMRRAPNPAVIAWLDQQPRSDLYLCAPVVGELRYGIARLEESERKRGLSLLFEQIVTAKFAGRILPFDVDAAEAYGELVAKLERGGRTIDLIDAMIAAIARTNGAALATRNTVDFLRADVPVIDPFDQQ